ncbi:SPOR domain-containing protein [Inmirania thermothiophila]|uniref:Sporulation related protein n=1 Tax=Inmirania thermothiophila TaxID=1750597 RepID=A0A3N1Y680_9GAMM|nr:SPOR domain-containing protein [Inmirania thermothiophila]ROR34313.1 sporulation related protein [Inmirania thermothiophila]
MSGGGARKPARSQARPRRPAGSYAGWAWLAAGLAIGLFVAFLVYLHEHRAPVPVAAAPEAPATPAPRFDFYTILPEQEVVVPEEGRATPREERPEAAPARYLLQVGSFRTWAQADALRARLALLGVEASIERVRLADGEVWHRVRVGPFDSLRELSRIQDRLRRADIQSIRVRIRG